MQQKGPVEQMIFDSDQGDIRDWYSGEESCVEFRGKNLSETEEFHSGEMESQVLESWLERNLEYCEWVFQSAEVLTF